MYSEFEAFLRNQESATPLPPPPPFDFGSTPSTPSLFAFPSSFPSGSPQAGSSSASQDSPPSSAGIPTEDEIFCILNGFCNDPTAEGALRGGGTNGFGGMDHDLAMVSTERGRSAALEGSSERSKPAPTEFLDLDPFFQFGAPTPAASSLSAPNQSFQQPHHLPFDSSASSSTPLAGIIPFPSFLLSSYKSQKPSYYAHLDPLFANTPSCPPSFSPRPSVHSHHSSSSSSTNNDATNDALAALFPPRREPTPLPTTSSNAPSTKRKATSAAYKPTKANGGKKKGPTDHNIIERKYRDSVNLGFAQLRDSVPVLRVLFGTTTPATLAMDTPCPVTGLIDGLEEETKQGKATVLGAARDYVDFLQEQRSKQARHIAFLESRMSESQKQILRNAFEASERQHQPQPQRSYASSSSSDLASPSSSTSTSNSAPPPRKRTRSTKETTSDNYASDGGKVLLGVFASFSLFGGAQFASKTSREEVVEGGKVLGMTKRAVGRADGWGWSWKVVLGLLVCLLVLPSMRRLMVGMLRRWSGNKGRISEEEKVQKLEEALGEEDADVEELRRELGAPRGVGALMGGIIAEWSTGLAGKLFRTRGGGDLVDVERRCWERVAETQMRLPTDFKSYLTSLYTYFRLSNLSSSNSTPSSRPLALLSLLSVSLAGGDLNPTSSSLWTSARAALPSSPSGPEDRTMAEILELNLADVLSISPQIFTSTSAPLESIASSLVLRDILHVWQTLFSSFAPLPSTQASSSSLPLIDVIATPPILADSFKQALLSSDIASLVASTTPGSEAHELALVCSGGWSLLTKDAEGVHWSAGRLVGQGIHSTLGEGGKALLAAAGGGLETLTDDELSSSSPSSDSNHHPIIQQINSISSFLIAYHSFIHSLPSSLSFHSKSTNARGILPRTLELRARLNSPDLDSNGGLAIDEDAKERFVDGLYGLGRWSVGWRDLAEEDSGYSSE